MKMFLIITAATFLAGVFRLWRRGEPGKKIESYQVRYLEAVLIQEQEGLLAGVRHMRKNSSPGDYLKYLIDRARWAAARSEQGLGIHNLRGLDNLNSYMNADLPEGVYNHQVAAGIEKYCLRIIADADAAAGADIQPADE